MHEPLWLCATPPISWAKSFRALLQRRCSERGCTRLNGTREVYNVRRGFTMEGAQYVYRPDCVSKVEVAVLVWVMVCLMDESSADTSDLYWHMRPCHMVDDVGALFREAPSPSRLSTQSQFSMLAYWHRFRRSIVDGKRRVQTLICNARNSGLVWGQRLQSGFVSG